MPIAFGKQISESILGGRKNLAALGMLVILGWGMVYAPVSLALVLLVALTLMLGLIKPRILLYLGLSLLITDILQQYYYINAPAFDESITINAAAIVLLIAFAFWGVGRLTRLYPPLVHSNTLDLPVVIFGLSGWVSLLWTPYIFEGLRTQMICLQGLIAYLAITRLIQTPSQVKSLGKFWYFAGVFLVAMFVMTIFISDFQPFPGNWEIVEQRLYVRSIKILKYDGTRDTVSGILSKAKHLSAMLSIAIPLTVAFLCTQQRWLFRVLIQISLLLMLILQILTFSRVDLFGLLVGWLTFSYLTPSWRPKFFRYQFFMVSYFCVAFVVALLLLTNFYPTGLLDFNAYYLGGQGQKLFTLPSATTDTSEIGGLSLGAGSALVRLDLLLVALRALWETCGFGAGAGGILRGTGRPIAPSFMEVFLSHGYGLLSYILIAWVVANMAIEMRKSLHWCQDEDYLIYFRAFCWILVSFAIMSFLDITHYWLGLGLGMAAAQAVYQTRNSLPARMRGAPGTRETSGKAV